MGFSFKFFIVAILLSFLAGAFAYVPHWLPFYNGDINFIILMNFAFSPLMFVFGVVLPFLIMYGLGKRVEPTSEFKPIIVSIFAGCWIGGVSAFAVDFFISLYRGSEYTYFRFYPLWAPWILFTFAFSELFFVSLTAVLYAHYKRTVGENGLP